MRGAISFIRDDRGGPLAEMAVLLVPFLLIFALIVQGGDLLWRHQISQKAVRDATRYVSRVQLLFDEACVLDGDVLASVTASAKLLGATGSLDGGPPLVPNWTTANIQISTPVVVSTNPCRAVVQAIANVDLPLPFAPLLRLIDPAQGDTISFSVADQARWLGE